MDICGEAYIQSRLLTVPADPQAILRDPWY
jgi:hypothetical protein